MIKCSVQQNNKTVVFENLCVTNNIKIYISVNWLNFYVNVRICRIKVII